MNRFAKLSVFALISVLMLTACSSKQSPVDDLTELSYKLQEDSENYSSKDWESAITKYAQIEKVTRISSKKTVLNAMICKLVSLSLS